MKRIIILLATFWTVGMSAQTAERYEQRYDLLVSQFGPAGVGVETVLDRWAEVDSTNAKMLFARFRFLFTKAQTTSVVVGKRTAVFHGNMMGRADRGTLSALDAGIIKCNYRSHIFTSF